MPVVREHDKPARSNPRLLFAFAAALLAVVIWVVNLRDPQVAVLMLGFCKDVVLAGLGAHVAVNVSDAAQAIFSRTRDDSTQTLVTRRDPKDFDVPLDQVGS